MATGSPWYSRPRVSTQFSLACSPGLLRGRRETAVRRAGLPRQHKRLTMGGRRWQVPSDINASDVLQIEARFPGRGGNRRVTLRLRIGQNVLGGDTSAPTVNGLQDYDMVWLGHSLSPESPPEVDSFDGDFYRAESYFNPVTQQDTWRFLAAAMGTHGNWSSGIATDQCAWSPDSMRSAWSSSPSVSSQVMPTIHRVCRLGGPRPRPGAPEFRRV